MTSTAFIKFCNHDAATIAVATIAVCLSATAFTVFGRPVRLAHPILRDIYRLTRIMQHIGCHGCMDSDAPSFLQLRPPGPTVTMQ